MIQRRNRWSPKAKPAAFRKKFFLKKRFQRKRTKLFSAASRRSVGRLIIRSADKYTVQQQTGRDPTAIPLAVNAVQGKTTPFLSLFRKNQWNDYKANESARQTFVYRRRTSFRDALSRSAALPREEAFESLPAAFAPFDKPIRDKNRKSVFARNKNIPTPILPFHSLFMRLTSKIDRDRLHFSRKSFIIASRRVRGFSSGSSRSDSIGPCSILLTSRSNA